MRFINLSEVHEQVKVLDGKLFFGKKEVEDCQFIKEDKIASLYVVRVFNGGYWEFVTGFDLIGKDFWINGCTLKMWNNGRQLSLPPSKYQDFDYIERVFNELCADTIGKDWKIFEEEDFDKF